MARADAGAMTALVQATTLAQALAALAEHRARHGSGLRCLAGGTDLMVELHAGKPAPAHVLDLWPLAELRGIAREDLGLRLYALTTCSELLASPLVGSHADLLAHAAREVGAEQIRNRATLGGNLGTASPAADLVPALLALEARVRLRSVRGPREVPVHEFLTGYRTTARADDELIESVWIPPRPDGERRAFRKVGTRNAQSIAKVVVAVAVCTLGNRVTALRAAAGSVAERAVLLPALAQALVGQPVDAALLVAAARRCARSDIRPIDDVRSTASYRRHTLARVLASLLQDLCLPPA